MIVVVPPGGGAAPVADASGVPAPHATPSPSDPILDPARPADAAAALTERRLDLLAAEDPDIAAVDLPGSPAYDADLALLAQFRDAGVRPVEPRATVTAVVETPGPDPERTTVRVEYVVEAHDQVAADGTRTEVPASGPHTATLDLEWTDDGWRVTAVA